jgi:hypothetical protein
MQSRIKYLGFMLNPNKYGVEDWKWMLSCVKRRINLQCNKHISKGGQLTLIKSIIEAIPIYWHILAQILKGILAWIIKIYFNYIWKGNTKYIGSHIINYKCLSKPKDLGGWGVNDLSIFCKSQALKSVWVFLTQDSL